MNIPSLKATLEFKNDATLGECPVWDEKNSQLYWVDILSGRLFRYDPGRQKNTVFEINEHIGSFALREKGGVIMALKSGFAFLAFETGRITYLSDPESHLSDHRFNDGKCDPSGRFWAGTLSYDQTEGAGTLYCINSRQKIWERLEQLSIPNGMAWNADTHIFYLVDSPKRTVYSFDFDQITGTIRNRSIAFKLDSIDGVPDGMTIDSDNKLWIAIYDGAKVIRVEPASGHILYEVIVPVPQVTSCTFGGPDFNDLYITTAREHMSKEQIEKDPLSGSLFKAKLPFKGSPASRFAG